MVASYKTHIKLKKDERRIFSTNELNDRNKGLQEKTVITIAHRISSLKYCDCLYKLEKGIILGPYTYDDFLLTLEDKSLA